MFDLRLPNAATFNADDGLPDMSRDQHAEPSSTPRIYCFINGRWGSGDLIAVALAEDGTCLGQHASSSESWAKRDIGFLDVPGLGSAKRKAFTEHYPAGYEVEWVDEPGSHPGLQRAFELNEQQAPKSPKEYRS